VMQPTGQGEDTTGQDSCKGKWEAGTGCSARVEPTVGQQREIGILRERTGVERAKGRSVRLNDACWKRNGLEEVAYAFHGSSDIP